MSEIYMIWEPKKDAKGNPLPKPFYYDLCQRTVLNHNPKAQIVNMDEAKEIIGEIPDAIKDHYIAHQTDWVRKMLVYSTGGIYVDSDFICLKPLDFLADMSNYIDMAVPKQPDGHWMDNFLVAKKGSETVKHAADVALRVMTNKRPRKGIPFSSTPNKNKVQYINWLDPSAGALREAINHWQRRSLILEIPRTWIHPMAANSRNRRWFFTPKQGDGIPFIKSCLGYMTSAHMFSKKLDQFKSEKELMDSNTRVADLIKAGLE